MSLIQTIILLLKKNRNRKIEARCILCKRPVYFQKKNDHKNRTILRGVRVSQVGRVFEGKTGRHSYRISSVMIIVNIDNTGVLSRDHIKIEDNSK